MVLQQNADFLFWGDASPGEQVTIEPSWTSERYHAQADEGGGWSLQIPTPSYGGPYSLSFTGENSICLENVMVGEVWFCSGQSNMEMTLGGRWEVDNREVELREANHPNLRLFNLTKRKDRFPLKEMEDSDRWEECTPENAADFSAVAFFFGREIVRKTGIPVGLVHASWGGTDIEAWISNQGLSPFPSIYEEALAHGNLSDDALQRRYLRRLKKWETNLYSYDKGYRSDIPVWAGMIDDSGWSEMELPGYWDNHGMQAFNGVVWFRKQIDLSGVDDSAETTLSLGYIDDEDVAYLNGVQIGSTQGAREKRLYRVPPGLLRNGRNTLALRVYDIKANGGIYGNRELFFLQHTRDTIDLSGNWKYRVSLSLQDLPPKPREINSASNPSLLFNGMVHPLRNFRMRGIIWYQGENNTARAFEYRWLFPALISDWRAHFKNDSLPFYFVQLANYMAKDSIPVDSEWAELREAQRLTARSVPHTGMAVAIDLGSATTIHPGNKQDVGKRIARIALHKQYGIKTPFSGPIYKYSQIEQNRIRLFFEHAEGIHLRVGHPSGFAIAGEDRIFHWAEVHTEGREVVVSSPHVPSPVAVRYAWGNNPDATLYNEAGLPASPFRTDEWGWITETDQ
ncbi:MAG: sialate O-acetylesterase [Proteiniphilum sp.]|nr:sialate O-acetylesterase [Proteiniphilum sp.]